MPDPKPVRLLGISLSSLKTDAAGEPQLNLPIWSGTDDRNLCSLCIQEASLRDWLDGAGIEGDCDFDTDHTSVPCMTVDEFAEETDRLVSFSDCN